MKISSQEVGRREDNKITGLVRKIPRNGQTKTYFDMPSIWLKRMILREQENVLLDLWYLRTKTFILT